MDAIATSSLIGLNTLTEILIFASGIIVIPITIVLWIHVRRIENEKTRKAAQDALTIACVDAISWAVHNLLIAWPKTNPLTVQAHPEIITDAVLYLQSHHYAELRELAIGTDHARDLIIARLPDALLFWPPK